MRPVREPLPPLSTRRLVPDSRTFLGLSGNHLVPGYVVHPKPVRRWLPACRTVSTTVLLAAVALEFTGRGPPTRVVPKPALAPELDDDGRDRQRQTDQDQREEPKRHVADARRVLIARVSKPTIQPP